MANTTVYLIRHSSRYNIDEMIENYVTPEDRREKSEKLILTPEGEKRAEILSNEEELQNIDVVYASTMVRTLQTAKYLLEKQNLKVTIDKRFNERWAGKPNSDIYPDWFERQYKDVNFGTVGGETQLDVRKRYTEAFSEAVSKNNGKRIAIFSHGIAITYFLLQWCKLINVTEDKKVTFSFKDKIICDKELDTPEVFKLIVDDKLNPISIELIEFEDLK